MDTAFFATINKIGNRNKVATRTNPLFTTMKYSKLTAPAWFLACLLLAQGCGDAALKGIPNHELAEKILKCDQADSPSPGYGMRCDNYRKECQRRRKAGNYGC